MTASVDNPHVGLITEGPGDAISLPLLLRRRLEQRAIYNDILGKPAICNGRERAIASNGLEGYVAAVAARPGCQAVFIVLDAEGDAACELGPRLLARAEKITRLPVYVALAERGWEDWMYASVETLFTDSELTYKERTGGTPVIKEALKPAKYVKPTWQPRLTARMDIELARSRSASLDRMFQKFDELVDEISNTAEASDEEDD